MPSSFESHPEVDKRESPRDLMNRLMDAKTRQAITNRELGEAQAIYDSVSEEVARLELEVEREVGDWADRFDFARDEFYLARSREQANLSEASD